VPRPKEWRKNTTITGYWFLDPPTGWHPPQRVIDFLGAGAAPLYLGFGSMRDKERSLTGIVVDALRLTRQRGVLLLPGAEPDEVKLPDHILAVEPMPFSWLLPRVAAVVHHGGLGTCHAALRAGTPQVVVPFMGDQSFWAQRVARLGVGPAPIPRHRLSAANLAAAIEIAVKNPQTRAIAAEAASQIGKEQGLTGAVAFIQRHLSVAGEPL
jgi:UDP:flavonoid glycosyltransferase YjiC (YdhE family)